MADDGNPGAGGGAGRAADPAITPAREAVRRLLPEHADQLRLSLLRGGEERFRLGGSAGRVDIAGTSPATVLTGLHWYLKYTCGAHISWAGSQLSLPSELPAPKEPHERRATVPHRFALNDTHDGYTAPYADWSHWERLLDVLALHGCNEVLVTTGQEAVYTRLLQDFGYSEKEARRWLPAPSHQPWWLLANLSEYGGPVSRELLARRTELGQRILNRMRELGIKPVVPGYFGTVPHDFTKRHPDARTVPQGVWNGMRRPDWLDPRTSTFREVASAFYAHQRALFGDVSHFKMDLLHEGGDAGDVPVAEATRAVEKALQSARPGATWVILGWQNNPRRELLDALADKERMLIVDGLCDLERISDRESDWRGVPYAFGSIPNFGGRTTIGAKSHIWAERFTAWRDRDDSKLVGTAYMPEATHRDPAAWELFSELAWREQPVDRAHWFTDYAKLRYGGDDPAARRAQAALRDTAYQLSSADGRPHDSIFSARPSLSARSGAHYATHEPAFDPPAFDSALTELLEVRADLRGSDAYRYDLTDVARQTLANRSWLLIDQLQSAYRREDLASFRRLAKLWLSLLRLADEMSGAHRQFLLGPWLEQARGMASGSGEREQLERTARTLLTAWANREAADSGKLANYANRDWNGMLGDVHLPQWRRYLDGLEEALAQGRTPKEHDWYHFEDSWARERGEYPQRPVSDAYRTARRVHDALAKAPFQGSVRLTADPPALEPGSTGTLRATFRNENGLRRTGEVSLSLSGLDGVTPRKSVTVPAVEPGERTSVSWRVPAPNGPLEKPLEPLPYELAVHYGPEGGEEVRTVTPGTLYLAGSLADGLRTASSNGAVFGQLGDRFAINGGGSDLWKATAEFGAVYRGGALHDGGSVTVGVTEQEATGPWARAGIVARNSLNSVDDAGRDGGEPSSGSTSGSADRERSAEQPRGFVNLAVTPGNGVVLSYDSSGDGTLDTYEQVTGVRAPVLLRLSRSGDSWKGQLSTDDGASWRTVGSVRVAGAAPRQDAGLFMTAASGGSGSRGTASFRSWRTE